MPTQSQRRQPTDSAPPLHVEPLYNLVPKRKPGRPRKLPEQAPLPQLQLEPAERELFDFFIQAHLEEHSDLTPTDQLNLFLAAIEYIKYCRMAQEELKSGQLVTMSRQHPGTQYLRLMESLSVTRKARQKQPKEEPEDDLTRQLWQGA